MNSWLCTVAAPGATLPPESHVRLAERAVIPCNAARGLHGGVFAAAATAGPDAIRPLLARRGALLGVGDVRLDNRDEVAAWGGVRAADAADLELVLAAYAARGAGCLDGVLGDFAMALWDGERRTLTALRDPFGVKTLFYCLEGGALVLSSRLDPLAREGEIDEEWVADFLAGGAAHPERTVWAGVRAAPPGVALSWSEGCMRRRCFWRAADFAPAEGVDRREAAAGSRGLLAEAVRVRIGGALPVWADLSGGPGSRWMAATAQALAARGRAPGLAGTVATVDTPGDAGERRRSEAAARRYGVRSELLAAGWAWRDDGTLPVATDEPCARFPFWARDRELAARVRGAGGRVLLCGRGWHRSGGGSAGAWMAVRPAIGPGPTLLRARPRQQLPGWLDAEFVRRLGVAERVQGPGLAGGSVLADTPAPGLERLPGFLERGSFGIEVRYPFLHRPLVEHSLRFPRGPGRAPGEATSGAGLALALNRERARLDELLDDPEIAWRGWVRSDALRKAVAEARLGTLPNPDFLLRALALETWLAVRSGCWADFARRGGPAPGAARAAGNTAQGSAGGTVQVTAGPARWQKRINLGHGVIFPRPHARQAGE